MQLNNVMIFYPYFTIYLFVSLYMIHFFNLMYKNLFSGYAEIKLKTLVWTCLRYKDVNETCHSRLFYCYIPCRIHCFSFKPIHM